MEHKVLFKGNLLTLKNKRYSDGTLCLQLVDAMGMPYTCCTVCIPKIKLQSDEVAIKNWSENEGILDLLVDNNIVASPHRHVASGYVMVDICRLSAFNLHEDPKKETTV